jgi:antitoxin ParD1/3/4
LYHQEILGHDVRTSQWRSAGKVQQQKYCSIIDLRFFRETQAMNVTLTPEQENYVRSQLQGGNYNSVQELISEALQLLEERNRAFKQKRLAELRQKIASGTEQIARGKVTDGEVVFARLQEKIRSNSESEVGISFFRFSR